MEDSPSSIIDLSVSGKMVPPDAVVSLPQGSGETITIPVGKILRWRDNEDKPYYEYDQESLLDELRIIEHGMEEIAMFLSYIRAYKEEMKERHEYVRIKTREKIKSQLEAASVKYYKDDLDGKTTVNQDVWEAKRKLRKAELLLEITDKAYWLLKERIRNVSKAIDVKKSLLGDMSMV